MIDQLSNRHNARANHGYMVYEPQYGGHRLYWLRLIIDACNREGIVPIWVAAKTSITLSDHLIHFSSGHPSYELIQVAHDHDRRNRFGWILFSTLDLIRYARKTRSKNIIVPYADGLIYLLVIVSLIYKLAFRDMSLHLFVFRGAPFYPTNKYRLGALLKRFLISKLLRTKNVKIYCTDQIMYEQIKIKSNKFSNNIYLLPDPTPKHEFMDRETARKKLELPRAPKYILLAGTLDHRKGADILIDLFSKCELKTEFRLLLAGQPSNEIRQLMQASKVKDAINRGSIKCLLKYMSEVELDLLISAADLVSVVYPGHVGPSGFMMRAVFAGKPVLGINTGCIGEMIKRYSLGITCSATGKDIERALVAMPDPIGKCINSEKAQQLIALNGEERFKAMIKAQICT